MHISHDLLTSIVLIEAVIILAMFVIWEAWKSRIGVILYIISLIATVFEV